MFFTRTIKKMTTQDNNYNQRYSEIRELAKGGQGTLFSAHDTLLERKVAIKSYNSSAQDLQKEIDFYKKIPSPHVAVIYDIINIQVGNETKICTVQEYVDGIELTPLNPSEKNTDDFLLTIYQIAKGILDIHSSDFVHRDLKPENIKYDREGIIKILDPGISNNLAQSDQTQIARGTRGYAAPELFTSDSPVKLGKEIDIYSFGVICRWLSSNIVCEQLYQVPPQSLSNCESVRAISQFELPDDVINLIDLSINPNPEQRPTITEIFETLEKFILYGKHIAELIAHNTIYKITKIGAGLKISHSNHGQISISYTGTDFIVQAASGSVYINNHPATEGSKIPSSCVITIGSHSIGPARLFATFNISHPGVTL